MAAVEHLAVIEHPYNPIPFLNSVGIKDTVQNHRAEIYRITEETTYKISGTGPTLLHPLIAVKKPGTKPLCCSWL